MITNVTNRRWVRKWRWWVLGVVCFIVAAHNATNWFESQTAGREPLYVCMYVCITIMGDPHIAQHSTEYWPGIHKCQDTAGVFTLFDSCENDINDFKYQEECIEAGALTTLGMTIKTMFAIFRDVSLIEREYYPDQPLTSMAAYRTDTADLLSPVFDFLLAGPQLTRTQDVFWSALLSAGAGGARAPDLRCDLCGKQFLAASTLRNHRALHRGETTCFVCGYVFSEKGNLKAHLKRIHSLDVRSGLQWWFVRAAVRRQPVTVPATLVKNAGQLLPAVDAGWRYGSWWAHFSRPTTFDVCGYYVLVKLSSVLFG